MPVLPVISVAVPSQGTTMPLALPPASPHVAPPAAVLPLHVQGLRSVASVNAAPRSQAINQLLHATDPLKSVDTVFDRFRLAGYSEELAVSIAEAFLPEKKLDANQFLTRGPGWFRAMCGLSFAYILGDVATKTALAYQEARNNGLSKGQSTLYGGSVLLDRGLFQGLSTWLLPIYLIKFLSRHANNALTHAFPALRGTVALKALTLAAGFLPSEYLAHALDSASHALLDKTVRPLVGLPAKVQLTDEASVNHSTLITKTRARALLEKHQAAVS